MKYNLLVLCLLFIFPFVLNRTSVEEFTDGQEKTLDISESDLYIGMRIPKNGYISLTLKKKENHNNLVKENFKVGLAPSLTNDNINFSNDISFTALSDGYTVVYYFEKGDNEYIIVHIERLTTGKPATIQIKFFTQMEAWTIAAIVLGCLLCVLIVIICICKKCCCR